MSAAPSNPALLAALLDRLRGRESLEVEFKRGKGGLPTDLWPTVSAFANTNGGWILVGVREAEDGTGILDDLKNPDARLQDFYNQIRNRQKISHAVCGPHDAAVEHLGGKAVLVIRVPAASLKDRPVYVDGNPYEGTYLRRNTGDYTCTEQEVKRMMREASDVTADSAILDRYTLDDLDLGALARYRRRYQTENPGSPWNGYDDLPFLQKLGAHRRDRNTDREGITVAGLLLFGTREALREWRGRHRIDFRRLPGDSDAHERWTDRVLWEEHLFGAFETLYPRLVADLPNPFRLREGARRGEGPAQVAMREALVNLLVHADYSETDASLVLRHDQGCRFTNPGSSRVPKHDLLTGDRSNPRNPNLVAAFRYIGLADEAGTGIPKILQAWRQLGLKAPDIEVGTERYEFSIRLRYIHFLSEEDRAWLDALGAPRPEPQQLALVHAKEHGSVDNPQLCKLTGQHSTDAGKTLTGLRDEDLLVSKGTGRGTYYELAVASRAALDSVRESASGEDQPDLFDIELGETKPKGAASLGHNAPSLGHKSPTTGSSLGHNAPSLGHSGPGLGHSGPEAFPDGEAPPSSPSFPGSAGEWTALATAARDLRQRSRVEPSELERVVLSLCARTALSISEVSALVGKSREQTRRAIQALMQREEVGYLYPDTPSSPKQRYTASTGGAP